MSELIESCGSQKSEHIDSIAHSRVMVDPVLHDPVDPIHVDFGDDIRPADRMLWSVMRIKLDENLPVTLVDALRTLGHDVDTVAGEALTGAKTSLSGRRHSRWVDS